MNQASAEMSLPGWIEALLGRLRRSAPRTTAELGRVGERLAALHLRRAGYRVLDRNVAAGPGEADLVALTPDRGTLVIVEVKTRAAAEVGGKGEGDGGASRYPPELAITSRKRATLARVAAAVAAKRGVPHATVRIDVIAIEWRASGRYKLRHHVGAVTGG